MDLKEVMSMKWFVVFSLLSVAGFGYSDTQVVVSTRVTASTGVVASAATATYVPITTMDLRTAKSGHIIFTVASGTEACTYQVNKYAVLASTPVTGTATATTTGTVVAVTSDTPAYSFYVLTVMGGTDDSPTVTYSMEARKE